MLGRCTNKNNVVSQGQHTCGLRAFYEIEIKSDSESGKIRMETSDQQHITEVGPGPVNVCNICINDLPSIADTDTHIYLFM